MSEFIGKDYVQKHRPGARLDHDFDGNCEICVWDGDDYLILGMGKTPMDAWHDAALDIQAAEPTPEPASELQKE